LYDRLGYFSVLCNGVIRQPMYGFLVVSDDEFKVGYIELILKRRFVCLRLKIRMNLE
jgi:hypothetical protein